MREVRLYGHLAKNFGRVHHFNVQSPCEALRALRANFPSFENHLIKHSEPGYHILVGKMSIDMDGMSLQSDADVIKIIPAIAGAGRGGLQILIGIAMIAAAFYTGGASLAPQTAGAAGGAAAGGAAAGMITTTTMGGIALSMGAGLIVGGVAQMLTKPPSMSGLERPENRPSYSFNGPVNTSQQGNPVAVCFGELIVGSQVVHAGVTTDEIPVDSDSDPEHPTTGSV